MMFQSPEEGASGPQQERKEGVGGGGTRGRGCLGDLGSSSLYNYINRKLNRKRSSRRFLLAQGR